MAAFRAASPKATPPNLLMYVSASACLPAELLNSSRVLLISMEIRVTSWVTSQHLTIAVQLDRVGGAARGAFPAAGQTG